MRLTSSGQIEFLKNETSFQRLIDLVCSPDPLEERFFSEIDMLNASQGGSLRFQKSKEGEWITHILGSRRQRRRKDTSPTDTIEELEDH